MAKNKTTETTGSVTDFINALTDSTKRNDSHQLVQLIQRQTQLEPKMWGPSIVGFGSYHYQYDSGHQGDAPLIGFSPRKNALTLYMASNFPKKEELLQKFGRHKLGVACIYIKKIEDIDVEVLKEMITNSVDYLRTQYKASV